MGSHARTAMMHNFLIANRHELERRCREKVAARPDRTPNTRQLAQGIPMFLDQLIRTLQAESKGDLTRGLAVSGPATGAPDRQAEVGVSAAMHGARSEERRVGKECRS